MSVKHIARALGAGLILTLATALGLLLVTRPLMRVVALLAQEETSFSVAGTVGILIVYAACLAPGALLLALTPRWWSQVVLATGCALLATAAVGIASDEVHGLSDLPATRQVGVILVIALMVVVYVTGVLVLRAAATRVSTSKGRDSGRHGLPTSEAAAAAAG
jgi:hypothetical protein